MVQADIFTDGHAQLKSFFFFTGETMKRNGNPFL
ncbi:MAG: hypothetical protein PVI11_06430 [Candidatus Aminicenantes bacterium]